MKTVLLSIFPLKSLFIQWSKKTFIIHLIISRETDLLCFFFTQVFVYSMIIMYKNDLELEWLQNIVLPLLVAG